MQVDSRKNKLKGVSRIYDSEKVFIHVKIYNTLSELNIEHFLVYFPRQKINWRCFPGTGYPLFFSKASIFSWNSSNSVIDLSQIDIGYSSRIGDWKTLGGGYSDWENPVRRKNCVGLIRWI